MLSVEFHTVVWYLQGDDACFMPPVSTWGAAHYSALSVGTQCSFTQVVWCLQGDASCLMLPDSTWGATHLALSIDIECSVSHRLYDICREMLRVSCYLTQLEDLHIQHSVQTLTNCNKVGLVKAIWKNHRHQKSVSVSSHICMPLSSL